MSIELNWYLPSHGDFHGLANNQVGSSRTFARTNSPAYLSDVARAIEYAGFNAILIPTGPSCHDAWVVAAALSRATTRLKFLVAFRPGFVLPAVAAQTAQSLQRITGGRLLLNVVTGGSSTEQRGYGDFLDHAQRYARTDEFLDIVRRLWSGEQFSYDGDYYRLRNARLRRVEQSAPPIYFGGASASAEAVAARHSDTYLFWGETPDMVRERIARADALASAHGRRLRYGYRVHVIARDTEEQAWAEADRLLREVPKADIEKARQQFALSESTGQARMTSLHAGRSINTVRDLEVSPNLWAGVGLVRGGAGTALVGSHEQVAERIQELHELGVDSFIFSGYPNLEEALRVGEEVLPLLNQANSANSAALRAVGA
ncbi:LLM class flavin-dependent oxidoreductase [Bordetella sp. 15P40C-2]|uniref:LLM class flavin-dependent oxidoreductase n=1 Tax=Bordetella sp. 15P40C-2 TaxID=2572246 RepID=UPI0013297967|nr:LLM class flavin-dependent oxidoreductase [Bordetella sp. 15P40C-2]MVW73258.1 LLM class flavin-dependent oxidoreductase [Bordetella sp. 15P40C-2]